MPGIAGSYCRMRRKSFELGCEAIQTMLIQRLPAGGAGEFVAGSGAAGVPEILTGKAKVNLSVAGRMRGPQAVAASVAFMRRNLAIWNRASEIASRELTAEKASWGMESTRKGNRSERSPIKGRLSKGAE